MPCLVRRALPADVPAVTELERACLGRDAWSAALVSEGVLGRLPTISYLVAEVAGVVVGHAVVSVAGDLAELQRIAVMPAMRRRGVARDLLAEARAIAMSGPSGPAERLLLEVREDNAPALAFYSRHGFTELARRPRYYADGAAAVVLASELGVAPAPGTMTT